MYVFSHLAGLELFFSLPQMFSSLLLLFFPGEKCKNISQTESLTRPAMFLWLVLSLWKFFLLPLLRAKEENFKFDFFISTNRAAAEDEEGKNLGEEDDLFSQNKKLLFPPPTLIYSSSWKLDLEFLLAAAFLHRGRWKIGWECSIPKLSSSF